MDARSAEVDQINRRAHKVGISYNEMLDCYNDWAKDGHYDEVNTTVIFFL